MQSIKTTARFAGSFSLLTVLGAVFAQGYISRRLIDFSDAAATATNIVGHPDLLRLGFAVFMVEMACDIAKTALFCELLKYHRLFPLIVGLALLGSAVLIFWLLVFGVDEEKWRERTAEIMMKS